MASLTHTDQAMANHPPFIAVSHALMINVESEWHVAILPSPSVQLSRLRSIAIGQMRQSRTADDLRNLASSSDRTDGQRSHCGPPWLTVAHTVTSAETCEDMRRQQCQKRRSISTMQDLREHPEDPSVPT
jgi:hypothetical protein